MPNLSRSWTRENSWKQYAMKLCEIIRVNHLFSSEQFVVYASPAVAGLLNQRRIARFIARDRNVHQQTGSSQNRAVLTTKNSLMW